VTPAAPQTRAADEAVGANALEDIALPAMLLKQSALENNIAVMAQYAAGHGFALAPHGKTTMAPRLFRRQLEAGAWGITVANMTQAVVAYEAGAARVLVANEVVSRPDARAIVDALESSARLSADPSRPGAVRATSSGVGTSPGGPSGGAGRRQLYCLVDSVAGVELLDRNLGLAGMTDRVRAFVELGVPGGRTGARSEDEAVAVAGAVGASAHLRLVGVEGYEGLLAPDRSPEALAKVDRYLDGLRRLTLRLADEGAFSADEPVLVSAGGSRFFDRVAAVLGERAGYGDHDVRLLVRSGCYLVHDHGTYEEASPLAGPAHEGPGLVGAIEVWADVVSVPEPGLAIVGLGRRDASSDLGLPVTLAVARGGSGLSGSGRNQSGRNQSGRTEPFVGTVLSQLNDQHGYLHLDGKSAPLNVGDKVGFGISHPCTSFDKWRSIFLVNDDYEIVERIATFFH
jgi:D-serine dehydratase